MADPRPAMTDFETAINANMGRLIALARAMLGAQTRDSKQAEDLVQDALLRLFKHRDEYDWSDGGWSLMAKAVARNVISCRRRRVGKSLDADEVLLATLGREDDPAETSIARETGDRLRNFIESLPAPWREVLALREQQGMGYREIAQTMNVSESQVKTWLHRARVRLTKLHEPATESSESAELPDV